MISNLSKYNNLTQRIVTAFLGAILIVTSIVLNEWAFFAVFFIICLFTQLEFYKLVGLDGMLPLKFWGTFCGLIIYTLTFLIEKQILSENYYFFIFPVSSSIFFVKLYKKTDKKPFTNIAYTFLGIIYVAIPISLLNILAFTRGEYSWQIIIGTLLLHWASDTGAYFAGVRFGKTKLFERVSPKKSWEGSIGGAILACAFAYGLSHYFRDLLLGEWFIIAGLSVIAGTYGDLIESLFKRSIHIKDSGSSIPGHGGFLDRFDGLLLSLPFIVAFLRFF